MPWSNFLPIFSVDPNVVKTQSDLFLQWYSYNAEKKYTKHFLINLKNLKPIIDTTRFVLPEYLSLSPWNCAPDVAFMREMQQEQLDHAKGPGIPNTYRVGNDFRNDVADVMLMWNPIRFYVWKGVPLLARGILKVYLVKLTKTPSCPYNNLLFLYEILKGKEQHCK